MFRVGEKRSNWILVPVDSYQRISTGTPRIRNVPEHVTTSTASFFFSHKLLPPNPMSRFHSTASSSSSFNSIIYNALGAYEKRTKKNLLSHPLAEQLQTCNSPGAILDVLQQQVQEVNQSQSGDEMLTKWLDPTVKVLYAFTVALGEGVGLVCFKTCFPLRS